MGHIDLDPVGAVVELFARGFARFHRAIDDLCAFRHLELGRVPFQHVAARRRDGTCNNQQSWPGNVSSLNRLLDADIAIACALGFHIPQCGKALLQRPPGRYRGSCRAHRQRRCQNVGVVAALRGIFALQEDVRVRIDQSGKHGLFREVDHRRTGGDLRIRGVSDALDAVAANDNYLIAPRLVGLTVDERASTNDSNLRR